MDFDSWISERLIALKTDESVFAPYIKSIVEGDESLDEKIDALEGILSELGDKNLNVKEFRKEILARWEEQYKPAGAESVKGEDCCDAAAKLESILRLNDNLPDSQVNSEKDSEKGSKNITRSTDSALRAAILNQYKDETDEECSDDGTMPSSSGGAVSSSGLERNTNVERVASEIKDKREREKADAAKKREKDREDRAKQKQLAQEKKDKAKKKTAKVERKR